MTQVQLAEILTSRLGRAIDKAAVNKMANGQRRIAGDELLVISDALKLRPPVRVVR